MHPVNAAEFPQMGFLVGLSLLVSLATLTWCAVLIPRLKFMPDRFLVAIVGLLCFLHIFRLVQETGIWPFPIPQYRLRLAEANETPPTAVFAAYASRRVELTSAEPVGPPPRHTRPETLPCNTRSLRRRVTAR